MYNIISKYVLNEHTMRKCNVKNEIFKDGVP